MAFLVFPFLSWLRRLGFFAARRVALFMVIVILSLRIRPRSDLRLERWLLFGRHVTSPSRFAGEQGGVVVLVFGLAG